MRERLVFRGVVIAVLSFFVAQHASAILGETMQESQARYGPPIATISSGNVTICMYDMDGYTVSERYSADGICIESNKKESSATTSGTTAQSNTSSYRSSTSSSQSTQRSSTTANQSRGGDSRNGQQSGQNMNQDQDQNRPPPPSWW